MKFPKLSSKAILAPMEGVTNVAFRHLCRELGAGLTTTEFVNCHAILNKDKRIETMLKKATNEKPSCVQLFGSDPNLILKAALKIEKEFDIIDFNLGCPSRKVVKLDAGSALLKNPKKIKEILTLLTSNIKKPITAKIRITKNLKQVILACEKSNISALTIHARTPSQNYKQKPDWEIFKKIKTSIPIVIGNGDINSLESYKKYKDYTNYIMIGRYASRNPLIFKEIQNKKTNSDKIKLILKYLKLVKKYNLTKAHYLVELNILTKDFYNSTKIRKNINQLDNIDEVLDYFKKLN